MRNRWDDAEAARFPGDLEQRVYSARLIGADPDLVLHGGGNSSVKIDARDIFGAEEELLFVKGSGADMRVIAAAGFTPVRKDRLLALAALDELSDVEMARQFRLATTEPAAPAPSVESILHAVLPHRFVDHAHADAVIALSNTPSGAAHVRAAYGGRVLIVPYVMPGFELARVIARMVAGGLPPQACGLVLLGHGLFSFGDSARQSYDRLIELVTLAEDYLRAHGAWEIGTAGGADAGAAPQADTYLQAGARTLAELRSAASAVAGFPLLLTQRADPLGRSFARHPQAGPLSQRGPATPDHVIRTKRVPLLGRDVSGYAAAYRDYFEQNASRHPGGEALRMLDPAPRVILDDELGLCTLGRTAADADAAAEIYHHTIEIVLRAEALEAWQALSAAEIFAVEYWDLEQAKLSRGGAVPEFTGEVAVVTGAASGIGRACAQTLARHGAAVCGLDVDPGVRGILPGPGYAGLACDLSDLDRLEEVVGAAASQFGGIDMLVLCAGIFPSSERIESLPDQTWRRTFAINVDADLALLRLAYPYLRLAPRGGRVVVIASKNVPAPGPGAAAYSASKAALTQLARVAALEWGPQGIRVNVLHPNAVFDTGLWTEDVIAARAGEYGLSPDEYRKRNVLATEVTSSDVAGLVAAMCGPLFAKVTGAQLPVDGGNERVI